jgi:nucleotide-binding universal stress UspA family protein
MLIAEGDPAEEILLAGDAERCGLIVVGLGQEEPFGRFGLGRTIDRLLRRSRLPILVVKGRPRGPYRRILAATEFSASSRHAIELAARLFPEQMLTVFHAYSAPMSGLVANAASYRREYRKVATRECEAFLETIVRPGTGWREPRVLVEDGAPGSLLRDYVGDMEIDLVVLGSSGRNAIVEVFVGCAAKSIMHEVPCDTLLVRG